MKHPWTIDISTTEGKQEFLKAVIDREKRRRAGKYPDIFAMGEEYSFEDYIADYTAKMHEIMKRLGIPENPTPEWYAEQIGFANLSREMRNRRREIGKMMQDGC